MNTRILVAVLACTATLHAPVAQAADGPEKLVACATTQADRATSRSETQTRSQSWLDQRVPYSQQACHRNDFGDYRTDCSGYLSMAWGLTHSRTTSTLHEVATEVPRADLLPGDALVHHNHAALFIRWADAARTEPVVREHTGPDGEPPVERKWTAETANAYTPLRYNNVVEDSALAHSAVG
ncbi:hypothetical protein ABZ816_38225 [Actinosynnema sp. NPDC047251]|uniref:NlpC/P60 domain-containing protein n=1 Tax=Saccharothrix espanaensis (strain ATCC 51144 / DSM 44229 / JCM 9112 / NBRC 15066 / NRRL 15764) TaxID=1179773 RepID=K0JXX1_SACES|nr:hypothetical protein [Saccharothrix espanaensis]CCH30162.1 hypothetical protein BN6_28530 [Saccharothrix espanaensis DSM 44229]